LNRKIAAVPALLLGMLLTACPEPPPPGPDLVDVVCICSDGCLGGQNIALPGEVCTTGSEENVEIAANFLCESKETLGIFVCKIDNCGFTQTSVVPRGCPADNGEHNTGDFGQSRIFAIVPPSRVDVSGGDINDFTLEPDELRIDTTLEGDQLQFSFVQGFLAEATFKSDGLFGDDTHTIEDGRISSSPFTVPLEPDGSFVVPAGSRNFIAHGLLDGDRLSLTLESLELSGIYDEEANLFTLEGSLEADGADLDFDVAIAGAFVNRPPRAVASGDTTVECDSADETGSVPLSGSDSFDLEGAEDIALYTWYVGADEVANGENVQVPIALGDHVVTLVVADQSGSFGSDTLTARVEDTTGPGITVVAPAAIQYAHSDTLFLDYEVGDVCTGVDAFIPLLDGADSVGGHGLADGQEIDLLTELSLGLHTFSVDALDVTGNATAASVTFEVVATPESLIEAVSIFRLRGAIQSNGVSVALRQQASAAAEQIAAGRCEQAAGIYEAFINAVRAQTGVHIDSDAAEILITDAAALQDCS
jgi:hypothetical protein